MDSDGSNVRRLTRNPFPQPGSCGCDTDPNFSPDGKDVRHLTTFTGGRSAYVGSYSPDGKQLVLRVEDGACSSLSTMSSGGGSLRELARPHARPRFIDWGTRR